jgi:hypothetical protein
MDEQNQKAYDKSSALKEISEREQIIRNYRLTGFLDRDNAVKKILELRQSDKKVAVVTAAKLVSGAVPFSEASNQVIISELQMQIDILLANLLEK